MGFKPRRKVPFKGALFDNDGTLIDSDPHLTSTWHEMLIERGVSDWSSFDVNQVKGTKPHHAGRIMCEHFGFDDKPEDFADEWLRRATEEVYRHVTPRTGVGKVLDQFEQYGIPKGVVTSGPRDYVEKMLGKLGFLERFSTIVAAECVPPDRGKPAPDPFLLGAKRLGVHPSQIVVFEDSPIGIRAAKAAGMYSVGICRGDAEMMMSHAMVGADCLINEIDEFDLGWWWSYRS